MKLEILQENLIKGLTSVTRIISPKAQMPILGNVLLETENGQLRLTGTNLEITFSVSIGAKILDEGNFTVPARTLLEIVGSLPAEKVVLELVEGQMLITCGKFKAKINGIPASDWPKEDNKTKTDKKLILKSQILKEIMTMVGFSVAADESRPALTGVLLRGHDNGLDAVAADGFRLSFSKIGLDKKTDLSDLKVLIPAKALLEAARFCEEKNQEITVGFAGNSVSFSTDEAVLTARLISANFPEFEKIIPKSPQNFLTVEAVELLKAVKLAGVFARDSANIVKLSILNSQLSIRSQAQQTGENQSEVEVKLNKPQEEELIIAFNYHYLLDLLTAVGDCELKFSFTDPLSAGLFEIVGNQNFLHLIMPVRVQT